MSGRTLPKTFNFWRLTGDQLKVNQTQTFQYLLILDFEATCEEGKQIVPQEIIEIPCLKVNSSNLKVESVFHKYVKPTQNLTPFCTKLTGITQDMVDDEPAFAEVFREFLQWQEDEGLWKDDVKSAFVTSGDWDLKVMLPNQCQQCNIPVPSQMSVWINVKKTFASHSGFFPKSLTSMCNALNLQMVGRLHSGIDDCRNIHAVVSALVNRNAIFNITSSSNPKRNISLQ